MVPLTLRSDGHVFQAGGVLTSEGTPLLIGLGRVKEDSNLAYVRDIEFGTLFSAGAISVQLFRSLNLPDTRFVFPFTFNEYISICV